MQLTVTKRSCQKKSEVKQMRREGNIPAILYAPGKDPETLVVNGTEFATHLRGIAPGQLSTTVFTLNVEKKKLKAVLKEVQYEITSYRVSHLDFEELNSDVPVQVKVPINITGVAECVGIKLGGFLRQVIRFVKVECLPQNIPAEFIVDVRDLGIGQSLRLTDIAIPETLRPIAKMDEVVVVIAKR